MTYKKASSLASKVAGVRHNHSVIGAVALTLAVTTGVLAGGPAIEHETVLLSGTPAPGTTVGFAGFVAPRIDPQGRVAFYATLSGPGIGTNNDGGIWSQRTGDVLLIAREGDLAVGTNRALYKTVFDGGFANSPSLGVDEQGFVTFKSFLIGGDVCDCDGNGVPENHSGYWSDRSGVLELIVRANDQAPGLRPGVTFDTLASTPWVNAFSDIAPVMYLKGPGINLGNDEAIYLDTGAGLELIVRARDPTGVILDVNHSTLTWLMCDFDDVDFTFSSILSGAGVTTENKRALFTRRNGIIELLARNGDPAPGGFTFGTPSCDGCFFLNLSQRGGSQTAFSAHIKGLPFIGTGHGLYTDASGALTKVARTLDPAPGIEGAFFGSFPNPPGTDPIVINQTGSVLFEAFLTSGGVGPITLDNDESLWLAGIDNQLTLVAREGDAAPGAPADIVFGIGDLLFVNNFTFFGSALNASNQVVFEARLAGPGFDPVSDSGLYGFDLNAGLIKIAQSHDLFDVLGDGSDLREVSTIEFAGAAGNGGPLNDNGAFVFALNFVDGSSGLFIATLPMSTGTPVDIVAANPPADNPFVAGAQPYRDVLGTGSGIALTQGIGGSGTPFEDTIVYDVIQVTFNAAPAPVPTPANIDVTCAGRGPFACPQVSAVAGVGSGPYVVEMSGVIPPGGCTTLTFAGSAPGQKLQYQSLPGDVNMSGSTSPADVLALVQALNNGQAGFPANHPRYDINRNNAVSSADVLRLVQLLNGVNAPQAFAGALVSACQ